MGKIFVLGVAIAVGYAIGYRDARNHSEHIVTRAVEQVRVTFGAESGSANDIDAVMKKVEGKN
ncbi:MAG TPA: hypothetical protein VF128_01440 [Gemmatimonadaceae bacterium]|jgi:hypothetical protein